MRRPAERQKTLVVIVLDDKFAGALAYALQSALHEPAKVRVVRIGQPRERHRTLGLPLPIITMTAEEAGAVVRQSRVDDVLVVESPGLSDGASDSVLANIRRHAPCLVVEVDDEGHVVRASGPEGWTYSALDPVERQRGQRTTAAATAPQGPRG